MNIVQTLWTGNRDLISETFGWCDSQTHLFSWVLSCLTLLKYKKNLVLYTDSNCAKIFIDKLHLPYTDVRICYDKLKCPLEHWAYPKMLTYAKQTEPFIHVDGDLYFFNGFTEYLQKAPLIAQNEEIGTLYYKNMMDNILHTNPILPYYLITELNKTHIGSYNAGILGGNDIDFIQLYCEEAFKVIKNNGFDLLFCENRNVNNNLLYEQVLFYALVKEKSKQVSCIVDRIVNDNGYTYDEFCNIYKYESLNLLHILGGYKRNKIIARQIEKMVLQLYPEYYLRVLSLFPQKNKRFNKLELQTFYNIQDYINEYFRWLYKNLVNWEKISQEELLDIEQRIGGYIRFINLPLEEQDECLLEVHPYLNIFYVPQEWPNEVKEIILYIVTKNMDRNYVKNIVCLPCLKENGFKNIVIDDISCNIINFIQNNSNVSILKIKIFLCKLLKISSESKKNFFNKVDNIIKYLMSKGLLYVYIN
ncbi:DUF6734 family protein [Prevotella sp. HCN-7019]|uniref:DUF6734 family protein n=1 Tax=Prevotella sp. HCN-7019 TaxID=3134668 RepID=UPI0030C45131